MRLFRVEIIIQKFWENLTFIKSAKKLIQVNLNNDKSETFILGSMKYFSIDVVSGRRQSMDQNPQVYKP